MNIIEAVKAALKGEILYRDNELVGENDFKFIVRRWLNFNSHTIIGPGEAYFTTEDILAEDWKIKD